MDHPSPHWYRVNPSPENNDTRLIWIDLEMTGLDPDTDSILEIATLVTDAELNVLAEGPSLAIRHPVERLQAMDDWNRGTHGKSGLWDQVLASNVDMAQAQAQTIAFLSQWVAAGKSPICGNSICQDRRFLVRCMPQLERYFHYRNLDVSVLKELSRRWSPAIVDGFQKAGSHTAMADIRESVAELAYYRQFMGRLGGDAAP
ncbi:MAG: oligoribonuclease [Pseudoxanthomonas sp.]